MPGSHIAYLYSDEKQRQSDLLAFISQGILDNEKCITAVPEYPRNAWIDGLRDRGMDTESIAHQLRVLTPRDLFRGNENNHVETALDELHKAFDQSLREGWDSVRICMGFGDLYSNKDRTVTLLSQENLKIPLYEGKLTLLCTFNSVRLHPWIIDIFHRVHPLLIEGSTLKANDRYTDEEESLSAEIEQMAHRGALSFPFAQLSFISDTPLVKVGEEMDVFTSKEVEDLMIRLIDLGHNNLIVDLSGTSFLDVEAVNTLLRVARMLDRAHGSLAIYDPLDQPRKIFQLIRLGDCIPILLTPEDAEQNIIMKNHALGGKVRCP